MNELLTASLMSCSDFNLINRLISWAIKLWNLKRSVGSEKSV